ncbi:MAG TPA: sigma-54 dependent transcriptional regulator [Pyrinomonadaceae bacterium]|nr:sigma-54 dependent transcriptional regulator [Pyrinomonadaceae bacterium]
MAKTNQTATAAAKEIVLVVDDDDSIRRQLVWTLNTDYRVVEASSRPEAVKLLQHEPIGIVISDLHLPPRIDDISEGLLIVEAARARRPPAQVIVITGTDDKNAAREAVKRGAYGYFEKPVDGDEVLHIVNQAARLRRLEVENLRLQKELVGASGFGRLIGTSASLDKTLQQARSVARTNATVLITGESGTGKEMLARAIHEDSDRANGPFIAVSCAALPETLIESELFGHEKGAFTDATHARMGRFELADGGTLFLDEIGELPQKEQVKLLRVLQERKFERVGAEKTLTVDIRLIAASNRDLETEVKDEKFRMDLFYRLNVVPLVLPPLRNRREDIPGLAVHFAAKAAQKHKRSTPQVGAELLESLSDYEWPGNVRELENLMERLVLLDCQPTLGFDFLPEKMLHSIRADGPVAEETSFEGAVTALKKRLIIEALEAEGGNKVAAAKRLGISRSYLHRLISEFGIDKEKP